MRTSIAFDDAPDEPNRSFVVIPASVDTREAVVRWLVERLIERGDLPPDERESVVERATRREELGSTGIGRGVAAPLACSDAIPRVACVVGRLAKPLDWDALDGVPVEIVAFAVGPHSGPRLLEAMTRALRGRD